MWRGERKGGVLGVVYFSKELVGDMSIENIKQLKKFSYVLSSYRSANLDKIFTTVGKFVKRHVCENPTNLLNQSKACHFLNLKLWGKGATELRRLYSKGVMMGPNESNA